MPLDKYFNPERIKIQNLSTETPEKRSGGIFEPERDLTEEDWQWLEDTLIGKNDSFNYLTHLSALYYAKLLSPQRFEDFRTDPVVFETALKTHFETMNKHRDMSDFFKYAVNLKMGDPEMFKELEIGEEAEDNMISSLKKLIHSSSFWEQYARDVKNFLIVSPGQKTEIGFNEYVKGKIAEELNRLRSDGSKVSSFDNFVELAASCRIAFPEIFSKINLNEYFFEKGRNRLNNLRSPRNLHLGPNFYKLALDLMILSAEEVKITKKGLKITMPIKDYIKDKTSLPEARKF